MNPQCYGELKQLKTEIVKLREDIDEIRKILMHENKESPRALDEKEAKERCKPDASREHSKDRDDVQKETSQSVKLDDVEKETSPSVKLDPMQLQHYNRVVGETAYQLDRRVLGQIFQDHTRFYGFLVSNIDEKILQLTTCHLMSKVDEAKRAEMFERKHKVFNILQQFGYDEKVHPTFTEYLVNTYGVFKDRPLSETDQLVSYNNPEDLRRMAAECMPCNVLPNVNIIIDCLKGLAEVDGQPLFYW